MIELAGAHAVITGGSSGIGLATARLLARRGATVSLIARRQQVLDEAAAKLAADGARVRIAAADVADKAALAGALQELTDQAGPCDVLVTSAGLARPGYFLELDDEVFREMIEVDYFGTLHAIRAVVPGMVDRGKGSIVAVSSALAVLGVYGYTAYSPAKYAVRGLMEALRAEMRPHGVHVGCVFPPDVDTPQLHEENQYKPQETFALSATVKPMRPEDVAVKIVRGIERRRFAIYPNAQMTFLSRSSSLIEPVVRRVFDRRVARVRAQRP